LCFTKLRKLYTENFVKSKIFIELIMALKSTVVEFRFLQKAHMVPERRADGTTTITHGGKSRTNSVFS
jgi:hypothetical protein